MDKNEIKRVFLLVVNEILSKYKVRVSYRDEREKELFYLTISFVKYPKIRIVRKIPYRDIERLGYSGVYVSIKHSIDNEWLKYAWKREE